LLFEGRCQGEPCKTAIVTALSQPWIAARDAQAKGARGAPSADDFSDWALELWAAVLRAKQRNVALMRPSGSVMRAKAIAASHLL
jgi:hypothetical protein